MSSPRLWWRRAALPVIGVAVLVAGFATLWRYAVARTASATPAVAAIDERFHCATVRTDAWSPLPGLEYTGRLRVTMPAAPNAAIVFVIGDAFPLDVEAESPQGTPVLLQREILRTGPDVRTPADFWLGEGSPWSAPGAVQRVTLDAVPTRQHVINVRLGRRAPRVLARGRGFASGVGARVCAAPLDVDEAFAEGGNQTIIVLPQMREYFATGWRGVETASVGGAQRVVRWMGEHGVLLIPSARRGAVRVVLHAAIPPREDDADSQLKVTVNDILHLPDIPIARERDRYQWTIPAHAWLDGVNELLFNLSPAPSNGRALAFEKLELTLKR